MQIRITENQYARQASSAFGGYYQGLEFMRESEQRGCFFIVNNKLVLRCAVCPKWKTCKYQFRQQGL